MSSLALYVLSLILVAFPPGKHPELETREAGAARLEVVARALADSAAKFGSQWPEGPVDFARAEVTAFGWSMGFRREVQTGEKRGPAGETCFSDMRPAELRRFAQFDTRGLSNAELTAKVVGFDYDSLRRCFDAGAAALVHVRAVSARRCKGRVLLSTFALYANGNYCRSPGFDVRKGKRYSRTWIEERRLETMLRFRQRRSTTFPDWYTPSADEHERVAEGS